MKKEPLKDCSMLDPHERFQMTIKALAKDDKVQQSRLENFNGVGSRHYWVRMQASFVLAFMMSGMLSEINAFLEMFEEVVMPMFMSTLKFPGKAGSEGCCSSGQETGTEIDEEEIITRETTSLYTALSLRFRPTWQAFSSVCRSEMGLEPEVVLRAWVPWQVSGLEKIMPIMECLDPDGDIDRAWESLLRSIWQDCMSVAGE